MNKEHKRELELIVSLHQKNDVRENKDLIEILLKELARRLLLWSKAIKEKKKSFELGSLILFDVAFTLTGRKVELPDIPDITLSYFDKLVLASYFNWQENKRYIMDMGYEATNPYLPYIEIFKLGGHLLKFEYTRLEVYPFFGINIYPKEDYLKNIPFWSEDL